MTEPVTAEIARLKEERQAVILAHNYVTGDIQDIADFCGDSLELARRAAKIQAPVIVVCGVRFMAETVKLLSPDATVLLPEPDAGCPMADMADGEAVKESRKRHPDALHVAYVNTTAEVKAEVDVCCTSGNAEALVSQLPKEQKIVFLPDQNLGSNLNRALHRDMTLWQGCCPIHDALTMEQVTAAKQAHPGAMVLIHPECRPEVTALADCALSTGAMLKKVASSPQKEFIICTEEGILHRLRKENPEKKFYTVEPPLVCRDMKKITLEKIASSLRTLSPEVQLPGELSCRAVTAIEKMLAATTAAK